MHDRKAEGLSMNREFQVHSRAESGGAPPQSKTLARWLREPEHPPGFGIRSAAALWISHEVQGPNACGKTKEEDSP